MTEGRRLTLIKYNETHRDKIRERAREWQRAHKEQAKRYYAANADKKIKQATAWLKSKPKEEQQAYLHARYLRLKPTTAPKQKAYQLRNRNRILAYKAAYRKKNAAKLRAVNKEYLQKQPQQVRVRRLKRSAEYRKQNLAKYAVYARQRVALKARVTIDPRNIEAWWGKIRASKAVACYYCKSVMAGNSMHMDHVIPLKLGGPHSIANCCAACPPCNLSKNATLPSEWRKMPQRFLSL